jgi:hypothetical protein
VLTNLETALIEEPLRASLHMLRKLTTEHSIDANDIRAVIAAGVSREQIEDALAVCFVFNTTVWQMPSRFSCRDAKGSSPGQNSYSSGAKDDSRHWTSGAYLFAHPVLVTKSCIDAQRNKAGAGDGS